MTRGNITDTGSDNPQIRTAYLLNGYIRHKLTRSEHKELDDWVTENMVNQRVFEVMTDGLMEIKYWKWKSVHFL
jgi:hypothetical protein